MSGTTVPVSAMNRAQLKLAIMAWLHRASLATPVASDFDVASGFIALCEQDLNERLRARCMVVRTNQEVDGQYTTLPCDYLEAFDFRVAGGNGPPLYYVSRDVTANALWQKTMNTPLNYSLAGFGPDFMPILNQPAYPWGDGTPRRFTIIGAEIEWSPFPQPSADALASGYQFPNVEMSYYQRIGLGMDDTDTNAVLATYPAIYIYGSLIHSAPFLRDDQRVQTWATLYNNAVEGANREHERSRTAGSRLVATYRRLA
jgi:hypothetical protein